MSLRSLYALLLVTLISFPPSQANAAPECGSWISVSPSNSPSPRLRHAMAYNSSSQKGVLFGGTGVSGSNFVVLGDTWIWESASKTWQGPLSLSHSPAPRYGSALAYDSKRNVVVLFGGAGADNLPLADTWEFDGSQWTQRTPTTSPPARVFHSLAFDSVRNQVVAFGGLNGANLVEDTWAWNGIAWTKLSDSGPGARELHSMTYDELRDTTVLFGGFKSTGYQGDVWEFNGSSWTPRNETGPGARIESPFSYEPKLQQSLLFGGLTQNGTPLDDTWTWNGTAWIQLPVTGPAARRGAMSAYDSKLSGTLLFGGTNDNGTLFGDTWIFSVPDADNDNVPDCTDLCPTDPLKTSPGICGCGFTENGSSCTNNILGMKPLKPVLKINHKKVRVQLQAFPNVKYVLSYYEKKKGKKKPKPTVVTKTVSTFDLTKPKNHKQYVFSYRMVLLTDASVQSVSSATRTFKVSYKK